MRSPALALLLLAALLVAAYLPVLGHGFVWDDDQYVLDNAQVRRGLTPGGLGWSLTAFSAGNWHPLAWLSHMADVSLFGLRPAGHHAVNLALHLANALLLFLFLRLATGAPWPAFWATALWSLHPARVEVAAWVAERKELLAVLFSLLALLAWLDWTRRGGAARYGAALLLFALALASKPMPVTLPFLLLILDRWPLERLDRGNWTRRIIEKLPWFLLSGAAALAAFLAQRSAGYITPYPLAARLANAAVSCGQYVVQTLWPVGLLPFHPHPAGGLPLSVAALSLMALLVLTAAVWTAPRRHGYLLAGWLWYLAALVPVLGLVQVGSQAMADRYTYLPAIGLAVMVAWGASEAVRARPALRPAAVAVGLAVLVVLAGLTRAQTRIWKDETILWGKVVARYPGSSLARNNLGVALGRKGRHGEAVEHFREALRLSPGDEEILHNYAEAMRLSGGRP